MTTRIEELGKLEDGWLEGAGTAPSPKLIDWLTSEVADCYPDMEYPSVAPTEEGHVVFEWMRPQARIELEFSPDNQAIELYATNLTNESFVETSFGQDEWDAAFGKVRDLLGAAE